MNSSDTEENLDHKEALEELRRELERRERNNLQVILSLVKLQEESPPSTAALALAKVSSRIRFLSSIYDVSIDGNEVIDIAPNCEAFVSSIAQDLVGNGFVFFSRSVASLMMLQSKAQTLGFTIIEIIADAAERARLANAAPRIDMTLSEAGPARFELRIRDEQPSSGIPKLAVTFAKMIGNGLEEESVGSRTERKLSFEVLVS